MLTSDGDILLTTTTDSLGRFRFKTIDAKRDYLIKLAEANPDLTQPIKYILDKLTITSSVQPVTRTLFENIYFDFDKSYIRPEAEMTLQLLLEYQRNNPDCQIEIMGNTDSRGSDEYNLDLSNRRSKAAYDYLVSRGFLALL